MNTKRHRFEYHITPLWSNDTDDQSAVKFSVRFIDLDHPEGGVPELIYSAQCDSIDDACLIIKGAYDMACHTTELLDAEV